MTACAAIAGVFGLVVTLGYYYYVDQSASTVVVNTGAPVVRDEARLMRTEEGMTVRSVSQILADLGAVTRKEKVQEVTLAYPSQGKYEVSGLGAAASLHVGQTGVWNPETYLEWARLMLPTPDAALSNQTAEGLLAKLLSPGLSVYLEENRRISDFLQAHPGSADGFLQAAILCGAIAFNDHSGKFRDIRPALNRMTAFLAAAEALGAPGDSAEMKIAEAMRLTLCGQQTDALAINLPAQGKLSDWKEIIRLRNTMDWRSGRSAAEMGSPALKHEYFRALTLAINEMAGMEFLKSLPQEQLDLNYCRIANETDLSVSGGHVFSEPILKPELREIAVAAKSFGLEPQEKSVDWIGQYLDTPEGSPVAGTPDGGLVIDVAGRNLLAGYQQRNLMQSLNVLYAFLNDSWGVKDGAKEVKDFVTGQLPALRYKPFLERTIERDPQRYEALNEPLRKIINEKPEMVTPCLWASLRRDEDGNEVRTKVPDFHRWYRPEIPSGTAFEADSRLYDIGVGDESDKAWISELHKRAPYLYFISRHLAYIENGSTYENLKPELLEKNMADILGYRLIAMRRLASAYKSQPAEFEKISLRVAEIDPDEYLDLARYFQKRGEPEKAAQYYLLAFEKARDRVRVANNALWLVKYLQGKGDAATAEQVAADAAETFSYGGLEARIWLYEATGNWNGALDYAKKCDERYNEGKLVEETALLARMKKSAPQYVDEARYNELIGSVFPGGLQEVTVDSFSGPPQKGVAIRETSPFLEGKGLKQGMVIVALDGYRTENFSQYGLVRSLTADPKMKIIVWDGQRYAELTPEVDGRRFGVDMGDYVARAE